MYALIEDALPPPLVGAILERVAVDAGKFRPARVGSAARGPRVEAGTRDTLVLDLRGPLRMEIEAAMRARLPEIVSRLGCQGFFATRFEMHLLAYPEGGHYRAHRDTYRDPPDGGRRISLACPLRPPGATFTGGDLVLLGDDGEPTVLPFRHNTATAFASDRLHEVLPVAGTGEGILGCRIAIAAWFHGARLVPVVTC